MTEATLPPWIALSSPAGTDVVNGNDWQLELSLPGGVILRMKQKQNSDTNMNDEGLRFDDTAPTQIIEVSAPQLQGDEADEYDIIDYQDTCRLAQQPGSYTVLIYRRPVLHHKSQQTLLTVPASTMYLTAATATFYCWPV